MKTNRDIIRLEEVDTIQLVLLNGLNIMLSNVVFALRCNSNLISLGQLRKAGISYYNYLESMILKKVGNIIGSVQKKKNLFVLNLENNAIRIIIAQRRGQPTHLLRRDSKVRLWYCRFTHTSNL